MRRPVCERPIIPKTPENPTAAGAKLGFETPTALTRRKPLSSAVQHITLGSSSGAARRMRRPAPFFPYDYIAELIVAAVQYGVAASFRSVRPACLHADGAGALCRKRAPQAFFILRNRRR